jgi:hypothetical protein
LYPKHKFDKFRNKEIISNAHSTGSVTNNEMLAIGKTITKIGITAQ